MPSDDKGTTYMGSGAHGTRRTWHGRAVPANLATRGPTPKMSRSTSLSSGPTAPVRVVGACHQIAYLATRVESGALSSPPTL